MRRVCTKTILFLLAGAAWAQQPFVPSVTNTSGTPSKTLFGLYKGSLVRSNDLGATWTPIYVTEAGLPQPPVKGFEIDALDPATVYLATTASAGTFWKSGDSGATWSKATTGLPPGGGTVDFFKEVLDTNTVYLYLKIGNQFYKSTDHAANWALQGQLPGSAGSMQVADPTRSMMFYVEPSTLAVSFSNDEGHSWQVGGQIAGTQIQNAVITGMGVLAFRTGVVYIGVDGGGSGQGVFANSDPTGQFVDQTVSGLNLFTKMSSATTGPSYAFTGGANTGFYRLDPGQSVWKYLGATGDRYSITGVDPIIRTTVYGVKGSVVSPDPVALVRSDDAGDTWTAIPATITPTIAKPASSYTIRLQEGAPYSISFNVQTLEDPAWKLPVGVSTTGESWIQLGATQGTTPLSNSITINTTGLAPGTYTSTLKIDAPGATNKTVSIPVQLTVVPFGSIGGGYQVSTVAGNGNPGDTRTSGAAASIGIGAAKALAFDPAGNVLISAGNRIWSYSGGNVNALAGNGSNGSSGDGADPLSASLGDPDQIAYDSQGAMYFTEFAFGRIRKLSGASITTALDMFRTPFNQTVGSHTIQFDATNRYLMTGPAGVLRWDGLPRIVVATPYPFSDPYSMISDSAGNLYVSDRGKNQIFKIAPGNVVSVIAGNGLAGFSGDGGPATQASLNAPAGIAFDSGGTLYIADSGNNRIRTIAPDGTIKTIAGSGLSGFAGDGSTSDFASFRNPLGVLVDPQGRVYVADSGNNRVRLLAIQAVAAPKPAALVNVSSAQKLSPGGIFVLYGDQLAAAGVSVTTPNAAPWPLSMQGVSVTINGVLAPLYFVSTTQINGQVPFETQTGTATAVITVNGSAPAQISFPVVAAEPGILVDSGGPHATSQNQDYSRNTASNPAKPGSIVLVYLSGIGQVNSPIPTNTASPASPLPQAKYPYSITVAGQQVQVDYLGYTPTFIGLVQANIHVPSNLSAGEYPVIITVNGESSLAANISVRP